jgi:type I protein arginine methyltransferase
MHDSCVTVFVVSGILSMFAAKAGAEHVYGIDMSGIVEQAKNIVEKNGLADKVSF